ncbi:MAG: NAD-dependent epimerase/dehydratase family protein [Polyangiales bacterium]
MRILVTGGAGFIGSHISRDLLSAGHEVAVIDDLSSGKRENLAEGARLFEVDIRNGDAVEAAFAEFRPEAVSHQAAQTSVSVSTREPIRDADINVLGAIHVLEAAKRHQVERMIFASTGGAIYGEVPDGQAAKVGWPTLPKSPYACSKLAFEAYLRAEENVSCQVLRYANVYGPRQDPHGEAGVVAIFAQRLLSKKPISVFAKRELGDEGCIRDYVFVGDVVTAHRRALSDKSLPFIVNVGTGVGTSTQGVAENILAHLDPDAKIGFGPIREGDLERSVLHPSEELGLSPTPLATGLKETSDWFAAQSGR